VQVHGFNAFSYADVSAELRLTKTSLPLPRRRRSSATFRTAQRPWRSRPASSTGR